MNPHTYSIHTRYSDLDTQWHINSAAYETYCHEARLKYLTSLGCNYDDMLKGAVRFKQLFCNVIFHRQQGPWTTLTIHSTVVNIKEGYHWKHKIHAPGEEYPICEIECLMDIQSDTPLAGIGKSDEASPFKKRGVFNGGCKQSVSTYTLRYTDLNAFHEISTDRLWRLNEESRWRFMEETGLSFRELKSKGYSLFWLRGMYEYGAGVGENDVLNIYTRVCQITGARIYLCQDAFLEKNQEMVMRTKGEFIAVSIEKSKPVRAPEFMQEAFREYIDN